MPLPASVAALKLGKFCSYDLSAFLELSAGLRCVIEAMMGHCLNEITCRGTVALTLMGPASEFLFQSAVHSFIGPFQRAGETSLPIVCQTFGQLSLSEALIPVSGRGRPVGQSGRRFKFGPLNRPQQRQFGDLSRQCRAIRINKSSQNFLAVSVISRLVAHLHEKGRQLI